MYHVFICFIWISTVHVFLVCYVQLSHVQWVRLGPGSIDLEESWCCDLELGRYTSLLRTFLEAPQKKKINATFVPRNKIGPDKGSVAWWWNHLGWALVEIPQVSTKPKLSSYNDAVGNGGKGENPGCRTAFSLRGFFLLWDGVAFTMFSSEIACGKKGQIFCCKKKNLVQDVWRKSFAKLRCRWRQAVVGSTSASMALESRGHFLCCLVVAEGGWNVAHNKKNLEAGDEVMCVCSWAPPFFFENAFFRVCMETVFQKKW